MPTAPPAFSVAAGILVSQGDDVLLVRTERRGWEFPGGQIEVGETILLLATYRNSGLGYRRFDRSYGHLSNENRHFD